MSIFANLLNTLHVRRVEVAGEELGTTGSLADREFLVPSMVCEGCAERIAGALTALPGVRDVKPNVPEKRVRVRYEPGKVCEQQLKDALNNIGFSTLDTSEST